MPYPGEGVRGGIPTERSPVLVVQYDELEKVPVDSSNVKQVAYAEGPRTLFVEFKNGNVYAYDRVPQSVWWQLIGSSSKGAYVYDRIRGANGRRGLKANELDYVYSVRKVR